MIFNFIVFGLLAAGTYITWPSAEETAHRECLSEYYRNQSNVREVCIPSIERELRCWRQNPYSAPGAYSSADCIQERAEWPANQESEDTWAWHDAHGV